MEDGERYSGLETWETYQLPKERDLKKAAEDRFHNIGNVIIRRHSERGAAALGVGGSMVIRWKVGCGRCWYGEMAWFGGDNGRGRGEDGAFTCDCLMFQGPFGRNA